MSSKSIDQLTAEVTETLESSGVLAKIRSEIRRYVFSILDKQSIPSSHTTSSLQSSVEGSLLLELVAEYLSFHHLDHTLAVLLSETKLSTTSNGASTIPDRQSLMRSLRFPSSATTAATPPSHSVLYELYLLSQTSRPSSPLHSPRSEDRIVPGALSHPQHSPVVRRGMEDLTPPISPATSPRRKLLSTLAAHSTSNTATPTKLESTKKEVVPPLSSTSLANLISSNGSYSSSDTYGHKNGSMKSTISPANNHNNDTSEVDGDDYDDEHFDGNIAGDDNYSDDEIVDDENKWARRYDIVERAQKV